MIIIDSHAVVRKQYREVPCHLYPVLPVVIFCKTILQLVYWHETVNSKWYSRSEKQFGSLPRRAIAGHMVIACLKKCHLYWYNMLEGPAPQWSSVTLWLPCFMGLLAWEAWLPSLAFSWPHPGGGVGCPSREGKKQLVPHAGFAGWVVGPAFSVVLG